MKLEIIKEIVNFGTENDGSLSDPSENKVLSNAGVATVTAHIEKLSLVGIIKDAVPIFGKKGGMWIGYSLSEEGLKCGKDTTLLEKLISKFEEKPTNEVSQSVYTLIKVCEEKLINQDYKSDFLKTLKEVAVCFENECYIATITLCGRILEISLKDILERNNVNTQNIWMIGNLLKEVKRQVPNQYLDPSLETLSNIISKSRNTASHYNEKVPIPSRDQTIMVIFATKDLVTRIF